MSIIDYVLKTTENTLDLVRDEDDTLQSFSRYS